MPTHVNNRSRQVLPAMGHGFGGYGYGVWIADPYCTHMKPYAKLGTARKHLKHQFGTATDSDPTGSQMIDKETLHDAENSDEKSGSDSESGDKQTYEEAPPFLRLAQKFKAAAAAADKADTSATSSCPQHMSFIETWYSGLLILYCHQICVFFGQKNLITIEDLFNWSVKKGWSMFWDQGKKHYQEEMIFYELLLRVDDESHTEVPSVVPIDVDATN